MAAEATSPTALRWLILGEWRAYPARVATAALAIAVGVALGFAVHLINASALSEFSRAIAAVNGQADLQVQAGSAAGLPEALYPALARLPGVAVASPVICLQLNKRGAIQTTECIAKSLYHMPITVLSFDKCAQIKIDLIVSAKHPQAEATLLAATMPVQVDADVAEFIPLLGQAHGWLIFAQRDLLQADCGGWSRLWFWRRRRCLIFRHYHAKVLSQRLEATIESLRNEAELPFVVSAVQLAQDQGSFITTDHWHIAGEQHVTPLLNLNFQGAQTGDHHSGVYGGGKRDLLHR